MKKHGRLAAALLALLMVIAAALPSAAQMSYNPFAEFFGEGGEGSSYSFEEGEDDSLAYEDDSYSRDNEKDDADDEASFSGKDDDADDEAAAEDLPDEDGVYDQKDDVALYIYTYGKLPSNYITKKEAKAKGWPGGYLEPYAPGKCIGGDYFGNYEGTLPEKKGRKYYECDIDTLGAKKRGAKRIIFSSDGLIYYTEDHYETFELLYGEE